jgi:molybdate transport system substrate-binding protein
MRYKSLIRSVLVTLVALGMGSCKREKSEPAASAPKTVSIAAAADLQFALERIIAKFREDRPDVAVTATYGSSGNFFAQLSSKAPFDVYLSADINYPTKLAEKGLAAKEAVFPYARGRIVLWVPNASKLDLAALGSRALLDPSVKRISIANPDHAPYGRAAVAAMKNWEKDGKPTAEIVRAENISQAAQFVDTGAADIGIIAESLAIAPTMKQRGRYWVVPQNDYPPIEQGGVILPWAKDPEAAKVFKEFLTGPKGKAVLKEFGFSVE